MVPPPDPEQVTHPFYVARQATVIGGAAAVPGVIVGALGGTIRTQTPVLFAFASGLQWFASGTIFWGVRTSILHSDGLRNWWAITRNLPTTPRNDLSPTLDDRVRASTISGAVTGALLASLIRGPRNIIPGTMMFTLFGFGGQHAYNYLDRRNTKEIHKRAEERKDGVHEKDNWLQRFAKTKWSPMTVLTDEQYEQRLSEQLLRLEAEIALVDERIEEFRKKQKEQEVQSRTQTKNEEAK
ncbi:uncharacterized protein BDR25DRAFT_304858 [Lindgomyces ingoldianus]|uniref:Uncharacterized protein n=1 Tax=Lindgomyces ingoldianus TaxID=673940 RepID=A0ACB6QPS1_9PLEO|nr:uncharacterized protein BDR25DRAFT_304858 [Lindgomyces ingoldianus]KAF2468963.1 hypothetical protein BDR25DRAFT_304858 [Lindgomyces ingoldianus]